MSKNHNCQEESQKTQGTEDESAETISGGEEQLENTESGAEKANDADGAKTEEPPKDAETKQEISPEEKIAALQTQLADVTDQLLRKAADFENFRKRMNQEKQNAVDFANQSLFLDIIPIIDDFERAIQAAQNTKDFAVLLEGVSMIEKRMISQFENKWGLKRYNSEGELFDPNLHEALTAENSPDVTEATVIEDLMKGYTLKDRVIRAAKVRVAMPVKQEEKDE